MRGRRKRLAEWDSAKLPFYLTFAHLVPYVFHGFRVLKTPRGEKVADPSLTFDKSFLLH